MIELADMALPQSGQQPELALPKGCDPLLVSGFLAHALRHGTLAVFFQDRLLNYVWAHNVPADLRQKDSFAPRDVFAAPQRDQIAAAQRRALTDGASSAIEIEYHGDAYQPRRWYRFWFDPQHGPDGEISGVTTTVREATDQKSREQTFRALLREVSHRSKNLLAIIQSIAMQTGRHSGNLDEFLAAFRGRLQSLSSSQDLVTSSNWRGASLSHLVFGQVGRYCADASSNIRLSGDDPYLTPNAALHIGLALHELAVNSASFGALTQSDGEVEISAHRDQRRHDGALLIQWTERSPAPPASLEALSFASVTLQRVVPASIGSEATLDVDGDRLSYSLVLPPESFVRMPGAKRHE